MLFFFSSYEVRTSEAISTVVNGTRVIATPAPTAGPELLMVLNALDEYFTRGKDGAHNMMEGNGEYLEKLVTVIQR